MGYGFSLLVKMIMRDHTLVVIILIYNYAIFGHMGKDSRNIMEYPEITGFPAKGGQCSKGSC